MTPKNREELISLIYGYVEGVDGADILADLESYGLAIVSVGPAEEMADAAVKWLRQPRMKVGHTRTESARRLPLRPGVGIGGYGCFSVCIPSEFNSCRSKAPHRS